MQKYAIVNGGLVNAVFETDRPESDFPDLKGRLFAVAPEVMDGWYRWEDGTFSVKPFRTLDEAKAEAGARIAAARYDAEFGGTTWNGLLIQTDRDSRAILTGEYVAADSGVRKDGEIYKFPDGTFRPLSNADLKAMTLAVRDHVKNCYGREGQLLAKIEAAATNDEADAVSWS